MELEGIEASILLHLASHQSSNHQSMNATTRGLIHSAGMVCHELQSEVDVLYPMVDGHCVECCYLPNMETKNLIGKSGSKLLY